MIKMVLAPIPEGVPGNELDKGFNSNDVPRIDEKQKSIKVKSEELYLELVTDVVSFSKDNLIQMHSEKKSLRNRLIEFCLQILAIQLIFLLLFLTLHQQIGLSDNVLSVFMTAVLVETLGAICIMIKFAFKSDEEVKIIDILNAVVKNFQKYDDNTDKKDKK